MDIVYVYKLHNGAGFENGVELLYSLRSLKNLPHNKVFIVGGFPKRGKNLIHIPFKDDQPTPYQNISKKLLHICENKDISDNFILMNDDFYILKPVNSANNLPYYSNGTIKQHLDGIEDGTDYHISVKNCYNLYPEGTSFNLHTPIIYNKILLKQTLQLIKNKPTSIRSVYGNQHNLIHVDFKKSFGISDCKTRNHRIQELPFIDNQQFLSSNDELNHKYKLFLNNLFPDKSIYEI